jgi:hypothetical protein
MKRSFIAFAAILTMLIQTGYGQEGVPYESMHKAMLFTKSKTIDGTKYSAFYIKSEKEVDFKKANLRLESKSKKPFKISFDVLKNINISELNHEDIEHLTTDYQIKIWIPKDLKKFKGWLLKHDLEKGSLELSGSRTLSTQSIEKARKNYAESLEE